MRKFQIAALVALVTTLTFISCSKETSQETQTGSNTVANFYATIDGADWKADSLEQVLVTDTLVTISGLSKSEQELSIILPSFKVGTYTVNATTAGYGLYTTLSAQLTDVFLTNGSSDATKAGGTVQITAIDTVNKTITGSFSFNAYRNSDQKTAAITAGVFNAVSYSVASGNGGGGNDSTILDNGVDTLSAFVDGGFFNAQKGSTYISGVTGGGFLTLLGTDANGASFSFYLPDTITVGNRALNYTTGKYVGLYNKDPSHYYAPVTDGLLTVLTHDVANKRITGTFSFSGADVLNPGQTGVEVTKGYFGITYQ